MTASELRAGISLAGVFGLRMLGLFLILPVFAVHARALEGGGDLVLVGIALGAYGLAQAMLQIPFGMASDRWGRKPVITLGLVVFALGSLLAAFATDIWTAIAGRVLQGAGAISSAVIALTADLTRERHRTKAMAMIGAMIGFSFALSLVAAPPLYRWIGMGGLFGATAGLALLSIVIVHALVPEAPRRVQAVQAGARRVRGECLRHRQLMSLNLGIFVLHAVQMAMFVVLPPRLVDAGLALPDHWQLYLPVVLASFALMLPFVLYADRRNRPKPVLVTMIGVLVAVEFALRGAGHGLIALAALMVAFFAAFNVLEALIPALVTRLAPAQARGTAIGVYNTTQTLGLFCGGLLGGAIAARYGAASVYAACAVLAALWLAVALRLPAISQDRVNDLADLTFSIASEVDPAGLREALVRVRGVHAVEVSERERVARLKVVSGDWDEGSVRKL
ncbi:MAG: MFS transporter, partial [Burkholderiales bacterium]|nr:MFS transporter [Burkholderiales bacterium]